MPDSDWRRLDAGQKCRRKKKIAHNLYYANKTMLRWLRVLSADNTRRIEILRIVHFERINMSPSSNWCGASVPHSALHDIIVTGNATWITLSIVTIPRVAAHQFAIVVVFLFIVISSIRCIAVKKCTFFGPISTLATIVFNMDENKEEKALRRSE